MLESLFVFLIKIYQVFLSSLFGGNCRFDPSCSKYAEEAILQHGAWRGLCLGLNRISKCHPFSRGGHDPVPPVNL